ncbi:hypothetical protein [Niabella beijingensis]|uniref:hypothetical protein n=1 Tax=Niabella beijingensis TaxID=2872700 RepID=UPI001CBCD116|nr:hypothetical protein [Niabella beijingensis]MBZ4191936.1 hypothetical protein [Niabella beijingensis]
MILLLIAGALYFLYSFFTAFAPPEVNITKEYISTNRDFINGISIEKLRVDSMGGEGYPVKYTVIYEISCNIHHPKDRPSEPPDKIYFGKPGRYSWDEDTTRIPYIHNGLSRTSLDSTGKLWWLRKFGDHPVCPIKFEPDQWYFITLGNPQVTGIFFYIDKTGKEHQHVLASGVSPI